jgi:DNA-binding transcriptional MerR regulator
VPPVVSTALKVGELARRTGLSVRTLRFYEEIGLLKPRERDAAGHRVYGAAEIARLQRVTSMRSLGFTLEEIGDLLDGREGDARVVVRRHANDLLDAIRETVVYEHYFTEQQLAELARRRAAAPTQEAWSALWAEIRSEVEAGTPPDAPRAQELARRFEDLFQAMGGGDPGIRDAMARLFRENRSAVIAQTGVPDEAFAWIGRARGKL